jgi:hypothetical protein
MATSLKEFSTTAGSNTLVGTANVAEGCAPSGINNAIRQIIAYIIDFFMNTDTIASATTTDLGTKTTNYLSVTGTTTITALGTPTNKTEYTVTFAGALILTHNATSLILPGGANVTTVAGDTATFKHEGSGNWRCVSSPASWTSPTLSGANTISGTNTFTGAAIGTPEALADGATITPDFATCNNFSLTIGGNRTLANPSNASAGQSGVIVITQDGTGGRTLAYGTNWKFVGGTDPTLSTAIGAVDVLSYYCASSSIIVASLSKAFA